MTEQALGLLNGLLRHIFQYAIDDVSMSLTHYDNYYSGFATKVQEAIRRETYGIDFGQDSWTTDEEFREFVRWLDLSSQSEVLDIASGSGGPAIHLAEITGARVTGLEINRHGIATARDLVKARKLESRVRFEHGDASQPLPFDQGTFDGLICVDAVNHLPHRHHVFSEWYRVLKPNGRLVFTDPIIVTGLLTGEEVAVRTGIGYFLLSSPGEDERLLKDAGFELVREKDVTESVVEVSRKKREARARFKADLVKLEGPEGFDTEQRFYQVAENVAKERRLSRFAFVARKAKS